MDYNQDHIVQKLVLKLSLQESKGAFDLQSRCIELIHTCGLALIESALDRFVGIGEVIQIDRLQLDLGGIQVENLETEFPRKLEEAVLAAMTRALDEAVEPDHQHIRKSAQENVGFKEEFPKTMQKDIDAAESIQGKTIPPDQEAEDKSQLRETQYDPKEHPDAQLVEGTDAEIMDADVSEDILQVPVDEEIERQNQKVKAIAHEVNPKDQLEKSAHEGLSSSKNNLLENEGKGILQDRKNQLSEIPTTEKVQIPQNPARNEDEDLDAIEGKKRQMGQGDEDLLGQHQLEKSAAEKPNTQPRRISQQDHQWEQLIDFLEFGRVDWQVAVTQFDPKALLNQVLETQSLRLKQTLPRLIAQAHVLERISLQFPPSQLRRLVALLRPGLEDAYEALLDALQALESILEQFQMRATQQSTYLYALMLELAARPELSFPVHKMELEDALPLIFSFSKSQLPTETELQEQLRKAGFAHLIALADRLNFGDIAGFKARWALATSTALTDLEWADLMQEAVAETIAKILRGEATARSANQILQSIRQFSQTSSARMQALKEEFFEKEFNKEAIQNIEPPKAIPREPIRPQPPFPSQKPRQNPPFASRNQPSGGYYVSNAGIVLLNPFLQPCFEDLGWMVAGQFSSPAAQEDALLLLSYMANGELEVHEAQLPLLKLLVGMDLDQPVRAVLDLPQRALDEAETLLTAASGHWEKAGKLTPDQLRGAFLVREGRLKAIASGWQLKVDRQTIDILLEFLPWSFGMIRLPWMNSLLSVDW